MGVLFLDLDGFKRINDTWGHEAGDHVIIEAASRLAAIVRETDIAARLGGDEFVLVFDQLDDARAAMSVVERLHSAFDAPIRTGEITVQLTVSAGFVMTRDPDADPRQLLRVADAALYRAKAAGRNRVELLGDTPGRRRAATPPPTS